MSIKLRGSLLLIALIFGLLACGVRGRPEPPLTPAEIGRGQPAFKRNTEELAFPSVPGVEASAEASPTPIPSPANRFQKRKGGGN